MKWYPCVEPVECLPFPSKINSLDWSSFPELAEGVGEVYGSPRPYNGAKAIPYAHGLTPCEPAQVFAEGDTYDPLRPPQKYDEKGFPLCCLDRFVSTGGLLWGGTAVVETVEDAGPPNVCIGTTLVLGQWYQVTIPINTLTAWEYYFPVTPSGTYRVRSHFTARGDGGTFTGASEEDFCGAIPTNFVTDNQPAGLAGFDVMHTVGPTRHLVNIGMGCITTTTPAVLLMRVD